MSVGENKAKTNNSIRGGKICVDVCGTVCFFAHLIKQGAEEGKLQKDGMCLTLISGGER